MPTKLATFPPIATSMLDFGGTGGGGGREAGTAGAAGRAGAAGAVTGASAFGAAAGAGGRGSDSFTTDASARRRRSTSSVRRDVRSSAMMDRTMGEKKNATTRTTRIHSMAHLRRNLTRVYSPGMAM